MCSAKSYLPLSRSQNDVVLTNASETWLICAFSFVTFLSIDGFLGVNHNYVVQKSHGKKTSRNGDSTAKLGLGIITVVRRG